MLTNVFNLLTNDNIFYLTNESFNNKSLFIFISQKVMCSPVLLISLILLLLLNISINQYPGKPCNFLFFHFKLLWQLIVTQTVNRERKRVTQKTNEKEYNEKVFVVFIFSLSFKTQAVMFFSKNFNCSVQFGKCR
jgi:hypothetical protein